MKIKDMTERELMLFILGEVRSVKDLLTNHLHSHEISDERRWKVYLILFGVFVTTVAGLLFRSAF